MEEFGSASNDIDELGLLTSIHETPFHSPSVEPPFKCIRESLLEVIKEFILCLLDPCRLKC